MTRSLILAFMALLMLPADALCIARDADDISTLLDENTACVSWLDLSASENSGVQEFFTFMGMRVPGLRQVGETAADELRRLQDLGVHRIAWIYADKRFMNSGPCIVLFSSKAVALQAEIAKTPLPGMFNVSVSDGSVIVGQELHLESLLKKDGDAPQWMSVPEGRFDFSMGMVASGAALLAADDGFRLRKLASSSAADFELAAATMRIEHVRFTSGQFPNDVSIRLTSRREADAKAIDDLLKRELATGAAEYQIAYSSSVEGREISLDLTDGEQTRRLLRRVFRLPTMDRSTAMRDRLKQIALAIHNYHDSNEAFPPQSTVDVNGRRLLSWRVLLLPYLGHVELYGKFRANEPWDSEWNRKLISEMPDIFRPVESTDPQPGHTDLLAPLTEDSLFGRPGLPCRLQDISDGLSNVLMVVSASPERATIWTKPDDLVIDMKAPATAIFGLDRDSFWCCIGDGTARLVTRALSDDTLRALLTIDGKEPNVQWP